MPVPAAHVERRRRARPRRSRRARARPDRRPEVRPQTRLLERGADRLGDLSRRPVGRRIGDEQRPVDLINLLGSSSRAWHGPDRATSVGIPPSTRGYSVRVENAVDVAQGGGSPRSALSSPTSARTSRAPSDPRPRRRTRDVQAVLGERPRDVLEQPRAVPGVDRDLHPEALRRAALPLDRREPLRVPHQRAHVRTVVAVDGDALAERDVADDLVAGHRRAALRDPHEDVLDADDVDAVRVAGERVAGARLLARRDRLFVGDILRLQSLQHLADDARGGQLPRAERDVELLRLLVARLADHTCEHGRAGQLPVGQVLALQRVLERLAALGLEVLLLLAREELADLVLRARGRGKREPVARRTATGLRGEDLDAVPLRSS